MSLSFVSGRTKSAIYQANPSKLLCLFDYKSLKFDSVQFLGSLCQSKKMVNLALKVIFRKIQMQVLHFPNQFAFFLYNLIKSCLFFTLTLIDLIPLVSKIVGYVKRGIYCLRYTMDQHYIAEDVNEIKINLSRLRNGFSVNYFKKLACHSVLLIIGVVPVISCFTGRIRDSFGFIETIEHGDLLLAGFISSSKLTVDAKATQYLGAACDQYAINNDIMKILTPQLYYLFLSQGECCGDDFTARIKAVEAFLKKKAVPYHYTQIQEFLSRCGVFNSHYAKNHECLGLFKFINDNKAPVVGCQALDFEGVEGSVYTNERGEVFL